MDFVRSREEDFYRQSAKSTTLRGYLFFIMRTTFYFSIFPLFSRRREKSKAKAKGEIVERRILLFSLDAIPPH